MSLEERFLDRAVFKVGGSLLFSPRSFLESLQNGIRRAQSVLGSNPVQAFYVVGGGELVEAMRVLHRCRPEIGEAEMHWICTDLMNTTSAIAASLCKGHRLIANEEEWREITSSRCPGHFWVSPRAFYHREKKASVSSSVWPSESWETTSDAIAWLLAYQLSLRDVYLLKSCRIDESTTVDEAAAAGIVDAEILRLSQIHPEIRIHLIEC